MLSGSFVEHPFISEKKQPHQNTAAGILCPEGITVNHPELSSARGELFLRQDIKYGHTHVHCVSRANTVKLQH